eukprot:CAMPEP_0202448324 /NCGR_PEP_ID=MMETSP1360-20130828/7149_1 /ASSEMBLY_ACC=CAM_ASM_000848 /TAXON_ID=515479 /ORGANISM="Licmophora paradoxa, Strain CCMP2313" /LENGTH=159 /DNA_ID=CAMNT_0049065845 /DNA_START=39 /DNA_END=518 /DNA_ORIENTATION=-
MFCTRILVVLAGIVGQSLSLAEDGTILVSPGLLTTVENSEREDATTHYGNPKYGCMADETPFQIQGVPGMICAPQCTTDQCPDDVPPGTTAKPTCALQTPTGDQFCALMCTPSGSSSSSSSSSRSNEKLRGSGDGECGDATCQEIQGVGLCTWDEARSS